MKSFGVSTHGAPVSSGFCNNEFPTEAARGKVDSEMSELPQVAKRYLRQRRVSGAPSEEGIKSPRGICELHNSDVTQERPGALIYKRSRRPSKVIPICGLCLGTPKRNEHTGLPEDLIACWACGQSGHPTCLKMPPELVARIRLLRWHCVDCKCCCLCQTNSRAQSGCNGSDLLLCDSCDRGFHMSCLEPKMTELPEGTWICPICIPCTVKREESNSPFDPRLDAISSRDQLTQQEIDWMYQVLNLGGHASPDGRSPSSVDSSRKSTGCGASRLSMNLSSDPLPLVSKSSSSTSVKSSTGHSHSVKLSKRLVQKSLATWAIPKSCASPNKTPPKFKQKILDTTASLSPVAPRPRRSSVMASEAWKSLVRRRSSQRSKQPEKTSVLNVTLQSNRKEDGVKQREQHEDAGKADILMIGETTVSSDQKPNHPVGRRKLRCVGRRGHVQLRLLRSNLRISGASDRSMSSENSRLKDAELAHSSPEFTSPSLRSTRAGAQPVQLKRSPGVRRAYAKQFGVYQSSRSSSISVGRPRGRMRNTWQLYVSRGMGPSVSTLKRWSAAGVNMKRALLTFNECGRVRLSRLNQSRRRRISHSSSGLSVPRLPTISSPASDAAREEYSNGDIGENDDDDDSSVTVAADNSGRPSQSRKKASSVDHFDPNNDECPEFSIITEENRALFASIQADVQACLPQPMESSLALPPANNPRLLMSNSSVVNPDSRATSEQTGPEVTTTATVEEEEARFPPQIQLGHHIITTWYSAPYPSEYARLNLLYICEFCLKYAKTRKVYIRHIEKCPFSFPPGNEIYRCGSVSVFEVDGYTSRLYCQQLCLLAKLFLDHKTLYYDVEPFLFYVVALREDNCFHLVGYFSKEKRSAQKFNLSCIMVLPPYQKLAYGRFLIDFSFLLSRIEGQPGSPEKPLSELGQLSYESYWRSKVLPFILRLLDHDPDEKKDGALDFVECVATIHEITAATGIDPHDVATTIEQLTTSIQLGANGRPLLHFDRAQLLKLKVKYDARAATWISVDEECLRWSPLIHPQEMDISTEFGDSSQDGHDSANNRTHTSVQSAPSSTRRTRRLSSPSSSVDTAHPTNISSSALQPVGLGRRSLRSSLTSQPPDREPSSIPVISQKRLSLRSNPTTSTPNSPVREPNSLPPNSSPSSTTARIATDTFHPREPRTVHCVRLKPPAFSTPTSSSSNAEETRTHPKSVRGCRGRKTPRRTDPSPCRKGSFFPNGPKPPDPPSPHGGFSAPNANSGPLSAGTRSSRLCRLRSSQSGAPATSSSDQRTEFAEQCMTVAMTTIPSLSGLPYSEMQDSPDNRPSVSFAHRVNSSLPEPDCLSPLRPALSSSPRTLTEKLLSEQFCVAPGTSSTSPKLPPSLSPPPPTLSLPDTMDSNITDSLVLLSCPPASPKEFSAPLAPPCLSFYDTNSHLSTVDNPVESEPKPIAPIARRIPHRSRKSMITFNRRRRRKRRFKGFITSTESPSLCRGQILNSFTTYNRVNNSLARVSSKHSRRLIQDILPTFSPSNPSGSPDNYSSMHMSLRTPLVDFHTRRFVDPDRQFLAHANSCPSLSDVSGCLRGTAFSFPCAYRHRRSSSLSELYTMSNRANVPIVNQHSPSHSPPPLLAPPVVVDHLFKPIPVLVPLGARVNGADTCLERLHTNRDSPSPPLLTTVMMDKKNSEDSRDVRSPCEYGVDLTCPPVLFPSKTEPQLVETFSDKLHTTLLAKSHRVSSAQPFEFLDSDASSSCSLDTIPMHLDGLNEAEPTIALAATPSSCSASHPTSPMSRQSSEDTVPMRLLTPSPPPLLLLNDSLFSDSFRFTLIDLTGPTTALHNSDFHLRSSRSSSEPHTSLVQDGHPPPLPLMQHHREKSCPSLLSTSSQWFGMVNRTDSLMNGKLALSEPYSHMMIDLDSVIAKQSHQLLDLPSQSTANATPDSFIDGIPSVDHSDQELKSAIQNSLESLFPEYAIARSPGTECAKAVTSVVTPCTEFFVPLREQPIMWNSVIVSSAVFQAEAPLDPTLQSFDHLFSPRVESPGIRISLDCNHSLRCLTQKATPPQSLSDPLCVSVSLPVQPCVCVTSFSEPRIVFPEPQLSESNSTPADSSSSCSTVSSRLFIHPWSKSSESASSDIGHSPTMGSVCSPPPTLVNQPLPKSLSDSTGISVENVPIQCSADVPFHSSNYMNFTAASDNIRRSPEAVDNQFRIQFPLASDQTLVTGTLSESSDFLTLDLDQVGATTSCSHSDPACSFELQSHSVPIRCSTTTGIEFFPFSSTVPSVNPVAQSAYLSPAPYPSPGQPTSTYPPHSFSPLSTSKFHSPPIHPSLQSYSLDSVPVVQQPKQSCTRPIRNRRNSHHMTQLSPHPLSSSVMDVYYSPQKFSSNGSLFQLPSGRMESHCGFQTTSSALPDYAMLMQSSVLSSMMSDDSMQPVQFTQQASSAGEPIGVFTTSPTLCCSSSSGMPVIQPSQLSVPSVFYGTHIGESFDSSLEQAAYNAYTMAYGVPVGHQQSVAENVSDSSRLTPFVDQTQCCSLLSPVQSNHASATSCSQFTVPSQSVLPPSPTDGVFTHIANVMNPSYTSEKTLSQTFFLTPNFPQTPLPFNADTTLSLLTSPLANTIVPGRADINHRGFASPSNLTSATSTLSGFSGTGFPASTPYVSSLSETSQINATLLTHSSQPVDVLHTDCIDASFRTAPVLGFACSTPMYQPLLGTPAAAVAALAPSPQPQQFVLCPPLLICSSGEPYMNEFCTVPNRPNRLHSVLPTSGDCPYSKPSTSIPLYPLVPQPPLSAWSRTDFPPGQSFSRPTPPAPPPHHVMPT